MIFFSILCALLIDHFRPMRTNNLFIYLMHSVGAHVRTWCDAGQIHHGRLGWAIAITIFIIPVLIVYLICQLISPLFGFLWNVLVLYLCMGFRNYNHYFLAIQMALLNGEQTRARNLLSQWCGYDTSSMDSAEITRLAIEKALISVEKDVFGIFFWFALPLGPAGAILYRLTSFLEKSWNDQAENDEFGVFAKKIFYWIDWIPVRLTGISFAVVGNFEDAIYAWRNFARRWKNRNIGVLLAAGGGAMGVRMGTPNEQAVRVSPVDIDSLDTKGYETDVFPGEEPRIRYLQSALGLIWRALLLWLLMLFLLALFYFG